MIKFDNTYDQLPAQFFSKTSATSVRKPVLLAFNYELAESLNLGLGVMAEDQLEEMFSGNSSRAVGLKNVKRSFPFFWPPEKFRFFCPFSHY